MLVRVARDFKVATPAESFGRTTDTSHENDQRLRTRIGFPLPGPLRTAKSKLGHASVGYKINAGNETGVA